MIKELISKISDVEEVCMANIDKAQCTANEIIKETIDKNNSSFENIKNNVNSKVLDILEQYKHNTTSQINIMYEENLKKIEDVRKSFVDNECCIVDYLVERVVNLDGDC